MASLDDTQFTVDTGLFRQLGELLVGRDSTAIIELIKNAYDADATSILLRGEHLNDPTVAVLSVADNGTGMTELEFRRGFLRLAARAKTVGERRSPVYRRRYTGEKGVGRLAAHKLAALLDVTTVAAVDASGGPLALRLRDADGEAPASEIMRSLHDGDHTMVVGQIDWDLIEAVDTLSEVVDGLSLDVDPASQSAPIGTTLSLSRLRHAWTEDDLRDVVRQLHNFEPPSALIAPLPSSLLKDPLLFVAPVVRDAGRDDPGLTLEVEGDFNDPQEFWGSVQALAEWVMEIRAARGSDIEYSLAPTKAALRTNPFSRPLTAARPHPAPTDGPFFDARILLRPGHAPLVEAGWTELNSGVRVYLEGFRVLPYGEPRNDWLSLDFDYTKRSGPFQLDPLLGGVGADLSELRSLNAREVSLRLLPNRAFFGAVFLTEAGTGGLRTLVNREGFVPDDDYRRLVGMVTVGLRLLHRARAHAGRALALQEKAERAERKRADNVAKAGATARKNEPGESGAMNNNDDPAHEVDGVPGDDIDGHGASQTEADRDIDDVWVVFGEEGSRRGSAARLFETLTDLRMAVELPRRDGPEQPETAIAQAVEAVEDAADLLVEDTSLLRVLASVGGQLTAFTHEIAHLIPIAVAAETALASARGRSSSPEVLQAQRTVTDIRRALERQASYLVDVASTEGRRRRSRQRVAERVGVAFLGFQGTAAARRVELLNAVPADVRTPPLFRAELQAVLTNLLSNAIKAAGSPGRVEVTGAELPNGVRIVVQNTGVAVKPDDAESWFVPYASTTTDVDPVLGQGMGLGLPITRDLISEYGGTVRFVAPSEGWSTAVEVVVPE